MSILQPKWEENCRGAATLLGTARNLPTPQMQDLVDAALRKVVEVRDGIIDGLREGASAANRDLWRTALDQLNVTLSELASVQYPGALERQHLDTARELLHKLLGEAQPLVRQQLAPLHDHVGIAGTIQGGLGEELVHRVAATSETLPHTDA
jgi:gamma-glutamyl:cysteine ligase YbdK (ATP-grasp superfamily)